MINYENLLLYTHMCEWKLYYFQLEISKFAKLRTNKDYYEN